MNKKKKVDLLYALTIVAAIVSFYLAAREYDRHMLALFDSTPREIWQYMDYNFTHSIYFAAWISLVAFMGITSIIYGWDRKNTKALENWKKRAQISKVAVVLLAVLGASLLISPGGSVTDYTIHVLGVGDEEFDSWGCYPPGFDRYLGWEIYIYDAFNKFHNVYGLTFELVGWISYDSTDGVECPIERLSEAISETGYQPFITTYAGKIIDLLMVFTGEGLAMGCQGLSYPEWKAMVLCAYPEMPRTSYLCHEFSHQFYVMHCQSRGSCCMYATWELGLNVPADWCEICRSSLKNGGHFNRFAYYNGERGACCGSGHHYRK